MTTKGSDPAFTQPNFIGPEGEVESTADRGPWGKGMTKREEFAKAALTGLGPSELSVEEEGQYAVRLADATI